MKMIDVIKIINEYSKKECYIEVLADGYLRLKPKESQRVSIVG